MPTTITEPTIATTEEDLRQIHRALNLEREFCGDDQRRLLGLDKLQALREDHIKLLDAVQACSDLLCKNRISARERAYLIVRLDQILIASGRRCHEPEKPQQFDLFAAEDPAPVCQHDDLR